MRAVLERASALIVLAVSAACGPGVVELSGPTMGTTYHVRFVSAGFATSRARVQVLIDEVLAAADRRFSLWREDSAIARFNAHRATTPVPIDDEFRAAIALALRLAAASDGAYDPTILPITRLWGFVGEVRREPSDAELAEALAKVGWRRLEITSDGSLRKLDPAVEIDLDSIAPGAVADELSRRLFAADLRDHMVDVGGEIVCRGAKPGAVPWRIGVERPGATGEDDREIQQVVEVKDAAVATSGSYRNWFQSGGARRHHILDARTGRNTGSDVVSVSVEAPTAMLADGLSTALMVVGPDRAEALVAAFAPAKVRVLFLLAAPGGGVVERSIGW
ncbi:MAG: FAD:protein FMN transferase [Planctomycetes bacterium]|nr:FAD:protein FMN transferase [Planctomycetota bacterium]